jgi:hypothetical protein
MDTAWCRVWVGWVVVVLNAFSNETKNICVWECCSPWGDWRVLFVGGGIGDLDCLFTLSTASTRRSCVLLVGFPRFAPCGTSCHPS